MANLKEIRLIKHADWTDYVGTNEEVKAVADAIGRPWTRSKTGCRAIVTLGLYPDTVEKNIAKLEKVGFKVIRS